MDKSPHSDWILGAPCAQVIDSRQNHCPLKCPPSLGCQFMFMLGWTGFREDMTSSLKHPELRFFQFPFSDKTARTEFCLSFGGNLAQNHPRKNCTFRCWQCEATDHVLPLCSLLLGFEIFQVETLCFVWTLCLPILVCSAFQSSRCHLGYALHMCRFLYTGWYRRR